MDAEWTTISKIECLGEVDDYVYDLSIEDNDPYFFANDILVHNTDSCYFSAYPLFKHQIESGELEWNKDACIQIYDAIAEEANASFPQFMETAFHCPRSKGEIIKAGRELVGDRGIFITKKRYAINIYDKEGKRKDVNGKLGDIKAMGLDLKRADTPKYVQEFLLDILKMVIQHGKDKEEVVEAIRNFKDELSKLEPWKKGSPKSVNKLTKHTETYERTGKCGVGHAMASINYNNLRKMHNDNYSMKIVDGMKIVVCKLKPNPLGMTSVAYPTDELRLPKWFEELPFDQAEMERTLVDEKIENLLGVLNWNLRTSINANASFEDLFSFA